MTLLDPSLKPSACWFKGSTEPPQMWKLTFRWQYCLPPLTAVSCSLGNTPSAAKTPFCPANPMVICWFLTYLNESLLWPWDLCGRPQEMSEVCVASRAVCTSFDKNTDEEQVGSSGCWSQTHSWVGKWNVRTEGIQWCGSGRGHPESYVRQHLPCSPGTQKQFGSDSPVLLLSCFQFLLFLICKNNNISLFFPYG